MQSRLYFINDKTADDYDRSTSLEVIDDICSASRNSFAAGRPGDHPGFRTVRIARATDAKLTTDDIEAWDDLIVNHVLPGIDHEIEMIGIERYTPDWSHGPADDRYLQGPQGADRAKARNLHGGLSRERGRRLSALKEPVVLRPRTRDSNFYVNNTSFGLARAPANAIVGACTCKGFKPHDLPEDPRTEDADAGAASPGIAGLA